MTKFKKILLILLVPAALLAAATGTFIYANKVIGIYSQQNFAVDGDFEKSTYAVSLSGGGSTAVAITSGGGIFGNALSITTPQNNDEVRIGINTTTGLGGLNCEARFNLKLFSTNTSPTIVDVDVISNAGTLSISNTQRVSLSVNNVWVPVSVNFPCSRPVAATFGRIKIIDAGVASSGTPIVYTDSFYAGEATNITNQVVVTDWQDFPSVAAGTLITATTTNPTYGTVVTNKAQYRYVGSDVEISWAFRQTTAGSAGSGYYLFNIPSSICVIDTSKVKANTSFASWPSDYDSYVGTFAAGYGDTINGNARGWVSVYSTSQLKVAAQVTNTSGSSTTDVWRSGYLTLGQVINFGMNAKVPCVGRSATQSAITQQCIQDGSCENTFSVKSTNGGVTSDEGPNWVNGNAVVSDTSLFTFTLTSNFFGADPKCWTNLDVDASSASMSANIVSDTSTTVIVRTLSGGAKSAQPFTLYCTRGSTDYKPRFAAPVLVGSVTSNSQSALRVEYATVGGASESTFCSTSSCNIYNPSTTGTFTATRTSSGGYVVSWPSNTWSKVHNCSGSVLGATSGGGVGTLIFTSLSQTGIAVEVYRSYTPAAHEDVLFSIECKGTR